MSTQLSRALTGALLLAAPAAAQLTIEPIVVTGDPAPVPNFGPAFFNGFANPSDYSINQRGDLALNVGFFRPNPPFAVYPLIFTSGIWVRKDGVLSYVAASGELLPNDPSGEVLAMRDSRSFNEAGDVVFAAVEVTNTTAISFVGTGASFYFGDEGGLTQLASAEDPALSPELPPGATYRGWGVPGAIPGEGDSRLNDAGELAYIGLLTGTNVTANNDELLVTGTSAGFGVLLREGDAAPGYPAGFVIGCPSCGPAATFGAPRLNSRGDVFVQTRVAETSSALEQRAIYGYVGGTEIVVARTVDTDPSLDRFRFLTDPETNDQGRVLFRSLFGSANAPRQSLFYGPPAGVQPVLESGDAAPGFPGLTIRSLFDDSASPIRFPIAAPLMNSRGEVVVAVNLQGPGVSPVNERALYFGEPGSLAPIVRAGDQFAGLPGSEVLSVGKFATNRNGLVVFEALTAPVGTFNVSTSLWAWEPGLAEPFLVAQTGEPLPFGNGTKEPTLVTFLGGPGSQSGFGSQLNDSGVLLFEAAFDQDATAGIYEVDLSDTGESIGERYCDPAVANSTGAPGRMLVDGSLTASDNDLTLTARDLPNASFGFFLTSTTQAMTANPGGSQGVLCLGGAVGRYVGAGEIQNSGSAGRFGLTLDLTRTPTPNGFVSVLAGETWNFQAWHRDSVGGTATSNFTDAVSVTFE